VRPVLSSPLTDAAALALDQAQQAFFILDSSLRCIFYSSEAESLTGTDRSTILGHCIWDVFPQVLGTEIELAFRRALEPGTSSSLESRFSFGDRWFQFRVDPVPKGVFVRFRDITEEKRLGEELARSRDLLALISESGLIGSFRWSIPEDQVEATPQVYELWGISPEQAGQGQAVWRQAIPAEDQNRIDDLIRKCHEQRLPSINYEFRVLRPDGVLRWLQGRAKFSYGDRGEPLRMYGILIDITELRRSQESQLELTHTLQQRVEEFETLFSVAPVGIAVCRDSGCSDVRVNPEFIRVVGASIQENWFQSGPGGRLPFQIKQNEILLHCEELPPFRAMRSVEPTPVEELEILRSDGSRRWVLAQSAPLFAREGGARGAITAFVDATALREADAKVRESHAQLQRLVESNTVAIVIGKGGIITEANDMFLNMVGRSRNELRNGLDAFLITAPEYRLAAQASLDEMRERGVSPATEGEYLKPDGTRVSVLVGGAALTRSPEFTWIQFAVDLSKQKSLERQLREANRQLTESNQNLERFAYIVAHDLQTPLRTVSTMSEMMIRRFRAEHGEDIAEIAGFIQRNVKQMSELISDLLAYSKIEPDLTRTATPTACTPLLERTISILRTQILETGAVVTYDPLPVVMAGNQLQRVFQNLIENALKYRGENIPRIHISATRRGSEWVISVRDNGVGFDMRYADQIFEIFKRLHGSERQGTGIGLAICRKLIEGWGGQMWADSEVGVGSTFYFSLPAA
jgi:PAS domain S-box-containing protein